MEEIWKVLILKGNETTYKISSFGRIMNKKGRVMMYGITGRGYYTVSIAYNKVKISQNVHRLVAMNFIDNPAMLPTVNHIDGDRLNNNIENLEWMDYKAQVANNVRNITKYSQVLGYVDGVLTYEFKTIKEASSVLGITGTSIADCNIGRLKSAGKHEGVPIVWKCIV